MGFGQPVIFSFVFIFPFSCFFLALCPTQFTSNEWCFCFVFIFFSSSSMLATSPVGGGTADCFFSSLLSFIPVSICLLCFCSLFDCFLLFLYFVESVCRACRIYHSMMTWHCIAHCYCCANCIPGTWLRRPDGSSG